ncbi:MAG: type II secretion system protein [Candidatus Calescibacterium sp.]|nr:type II secretion system GspH family protein [Candidatus Calescibacterium sp.]MDW8132534.1 type II secretion system protein [Candidatus Calescibacterium sp.]
MRKNTAFSLLEVMVVIAIIGIISGVAIVNMRNKERVILRTGAEGVFKFLKAVQSNATKVSPVILNTPNPAPPNSPLLLQGIFNNPQPANGIFEIRAFRLSIFDFNNPNNPAVQRVNNMNLVEGVDRKTVITFVSNNVNGNLSVFPNGQVPNFPISMIAGILLNNNNRVFIGFRTDGRVVLPGGANMNIRISRQGLRRRHVIVLPNESIRFELYSEQN